MRMRDIEISNTGKIELDIMELPENCVIILSKGKARLSELPAFAETKIVTHQGQVRRVKWDQGEEF